MGKIVVIVSLCFLLFIPQIASAQHVTVPNASFEEFADGQAPGWELLLAEGAEGFFSWTEDEAYDGNRALVIEKTNGIGYLLLRTRDPLPTTADTTYRSSVRLRVLDMSYGTQVYFVNQDTDAAGADLYPVHYSPSWARRPHFLPPGEWIDHWAEWTTNPTAAGTVLRFVVTGNPMRLVLDAVTVEANPEPMVHTGRASNTEPPYEEANALAALQQRSALPAGLQMVNGRPQVRIGEELIAPLIHNGSFNSPMNSRFGGFGRNDINLHTVVVQLGPFNRQNTIWPYPDEPDFTFLEQILLRIAAADPAAQVILSVRVDMPRQWGLDHPDHVWTDEQGRKSVATIHPVRGGELEQENEHHPVSYASPLYHEQAGRVLRMLGEWLRDNEPGKIVAGFFICGGNDGQFFDNHWGTLHLDCSPGQTEGFRTWLRDVYGNDEARLREAWDDPQVSFAAAEITPHADRTIDEPFLAHRGPQRRAMDSNRFNMIAPARLVRLFAGILKESIGRPTFAMTYYPDAIHNQSSNKYMVSELLAGNEIDGAVAVQQYGEWRKLGGPGGTNASWGVYRLRDKLHVAEIDYRTHISHMAGSWGVGALGAPLTPQGFRDQVVRDIAATISRGMGAWFYDMGGVWYDDPEIWPTIAESAQLMQWGARPEAPAPFADMAVFVDENVGWMMSQKHWGMLHSTTNAARWPLNHSGVPYDLYLLDDITSDRLPDYRVYLVLTSYSLTETQADALMQKARRAGRTLVLAAPPGGASVDFPDQLACLRRLTGLEFTVRPAGSSLASVPVAADTDALARDLPPGFISGNPSQVALPVCTDPAAVPLATFINDNLPAAVVHRGEEGTVVVLTPGGLNPTLINNIAREAQVGIIGTPNQVTYAGCGVAAVHHVRPGPAVVEFSRPVDLLDADGQTVLAAGVRRWEPHNELLHTSVVRYRPAE